jgi:hypothetical protein
MHRFLQSSNRNLIVAAVISKTTLVLCWFLEYSPGRKFFQLSDILKTKKKKNDGRKKKWEKVFSFFKKEIRATHLNRNAVAYYTSSTSKPNQNYWHLQELNI